MLLKHKAKFLLPGQLVHCRLKLGLQLRVAHPVDQFVYLGHIPARFLL